MWPSCVDNGAELTYGTNSNAYLVNDITSAGGGANPGSGHQQSLKYAQENLALPHGSQLFEVSCSAVVLDKPATPTLPCSDSDIPDLLLCDDFNIDSSSALSYSKNYHDLNKESSLWQSQYIYDPAVSDLLICETFSRNLRILVHTDGLQSGVVKFSSIKTRKKMISLIPDSTKYLKQREQVRVKDCELNQLAYIEIRVPVLGLTFSKDIYTKNSVTVRYLAVRTNCSILIYKVSCASFKAFDIKLLDSITGVFYDASFNYWNKSRFATISSDNIWRIWEIKNGKIVFPKNSQDEVLAGKLSLNSFSDLSRWKKIIWGNTSDDLIIFTRSSVFFLKLYGMHKTNSHIIKKVSISRDFNSNENRDQAEDSNKLLKLSHRHLEIVDSHLDEVFILTSQEIIWAKVDTDSKNNINKLKRIVSWKHCLRSDDPSLKFSLNTVSSSEFGCEIDERNREYIVLIFSNIHPEYISIRFRYRAADGLYYIVGGAPSLLSIKSRPKLNEQSSRVQGSILLDINASDKEKIKDGESGENINNQTDSSIKNPEDNGTKSVSNTQSILSTKGVRSERNFKSHEFVTESDDEEENKENQEEAEDISCWNENNSNEEPQDSLSEKVKYNYDLFDHQYYTLLTIDANGVLIKYLVSNDSGTKKTNYMNNYLTVSENSLVENIINDEINALDFAATLEDENFRIRDSLLKKVLINNSEKMNNKVNELYLKIFENKKIPKLVTPELNSTPISELSKELDISENLDIAEEALLIVSDWNIEETDVENNRDKLDLERKEEHFAGISTNFNSNEDKNDHLFLRETSSYNHAPIYAAESQLPSFSQPDSIYSQKSHYLSSQSNSQNRTSSLNNKRKRRKKKSGFA